MNKSWQELAAERLRHWQASISCDSVTVPFSLQSSVDIQLIEFDRKFRIVHYTWDYRMQLTKAEELDKFDTWWEAAECVDAYFLSYESYIQAKAEDRVERRLVMEIGAKYKVTYKSETQRIPRTLVAMYLGDDTYNGNHKFSGRPVFGTTDLPKNWILSVETVPSDTQPHVDKLVR